MTTAATVGPRLAAEVSRLRAVVPVLGWLPLAGAPLALLSVRHLDLGHLGDYGLPPALPWLWYGSLAALVAGAGWCLVASRFDGRRAGAYTVSVALVLFGTVPVAADAPRYAWVYKHIGVVRYIEAHGTVDWSVDIYHRWPGFFALSAFASWLSGDADPTAYVAWVEPCFMLIAAILLAGVVRMLTGRARAGWGAALVFVCSNWVGQTYFSPQAFGFVLALAIFSILLRHLGEHSWSRTGMLAERWVMAMGGSSPDDTRMFVAVGPRWRRRTALLLVFLLYVVIVVSHQLTPYMVVYGVGVLVLLGGVRPRWLPPALLAMAVGYLCLHLDYVRRNFGVFSSIDPFANAAVVAEYNPDPLPGKLWTSAGWALIGVVVGAALWGAIILVRRRMSRCAVILGCLAASPVFLLFGQSYGGEAPFRVLLFALPWASALAFAAFDVDLRGRHRPVFVRQPAALLGVLLALFVPAFYGQEELNVVSADAVAAADWFDEHAEPGAVLMLSAPGFPARAGARYDQFRGPAADDGPNLLETDALRYRALGSPSDVDIVVKLIRQQSDIGYLVFDDLQVTYAHVFRLAPDGALRRLESAVARSGRFRLVFASHDTHIYRLKANR
jgi:hypothetical protein